MAVRKKTEISLPLEVIREGRDEMNLVEYPFASLWSKTEAGAEIHHEWETQHPITGRKVKATWRVTGDPKLGLPAASDEQVYLALMELTQQAGLESQTVYFTRHDLIKRLGWVHNDINYRRLLQALRRLKAVTISAENAFWDASGKTFRSVGFSILDNYDLATERPGRKKSGQAELPLSFFKWNDVVFNSMRSGYIRSIDVGFALSLQSALALRLYRYLDKKSFDARRTFEIELGALCERHLGMRASAYPSKYKERLKPAHDELIARGFLEDVAYEPMKTRKSEKVRYTFAPRKHRQTAHEIVAPVESMATPDNASLEKTEDNTNPQPTLPQSTLPQPALLEVPIAEATDTETHGLEPDHKTPAAEELSDAAHADMMECLLNLKVSADVARDLMQRFSLDTLQLQLDCLPDRNPKDAAATLVKAIREAWEPPPQYLERMAAAEQRRRAGEATESRKQEKVAQEAEARRQQATLEKETALLDSMWEKLDVRTQDRINQEVKERLGVLGNTGRAQGALIAMRRNMLREMLGGNGS